MFSVKRKNDLSKGKKWEERGVIDRQRGFSSKRKETFFVEEEECVVEEKKCVVQEIECNRRGERMFCRRKEWLLTNVVKRVGENFGCDL